MHPDTRETSDTTRTAGMKSQGLSEPLACRKVATVMGTSCIDAVFKTTRVAILLREEPI